VVQVSKGSFDYAGARAERASTCFAQDDSRFFQDDKTDCV